ncbi:hypothetical protein J0672_24410, partial [Vibrio parahaemolyticus]|nr:hypothetical protein [Vibrio parahaemolyticus]
ASTVERWEGSGHDEPILDFLAQVPAIDAVGHRVVHGGPHHTAPTLGDDEVINYLDSIINLAPLHNPRAVAGIRELRSLLPRTPA